MQTTPAIPRYKENIVRLFSLREVLAHQFPDRRTLRMRLPPPGTAHEKILATGVSVKVENHSQQGLFLVIAGRSFPIVGCFPSRLHPGKRRPPVNLYLVDRLGKRVRAIFLDTTTGRIGSRHELGVRYVTDDLTDEQREQRRIEKLKQKHPLRWSAMLDRQKDMRALMPYRPRRKLAPGLRSGMWRRTWIEDCVRGRWGVVHPGDKQRLESEITYACFDLLPKKLKHARPRWFYRTLGHPNLMRRRWAESY